MESSDVLHGSEFVTRQGLETFSRTVLRGIVAHLASY